MYYVFIHYLSGKISKILETILFLTISVFSNSNTDTSSIFDKVFLVFLNPENVLSHRDEIKPYETDALAAYRQTPLLVVLPETVEEVSKILKYCNFDL